MKSTTARNILKDNLSRYFVPTWPKQKKFEPDSFVTVRNDFSSILMITILC